MLPCSSSSLTTLQALKTKSCDRTLIWMSVLVCFDFAIWKQKLGALPNWLGQDSRFFYNRNLCPSSLVASLPSLLKVWWTQRVSHEIIFIISYLGCLHLPRRKLLFFLKLLNVAVQSFLKGILCFRARFPIRFGFWAQIVCRTRVYVLSVRQSSQCLLQIVGWFCSICLLLSRVSLPRLLGAYTLRFVLLERLITMIPPLYLVLLVLLTFDQFRADFHSLFTSRGPFLEVRWCIELQLKSRLSRGFDLIPQQVLCFHFT